MFTDEAFGRVWISQPSSPSALDAAALKSIVQTNGVPARRETVTTDCPLERGVRRISTSEVGGRPESENAGTFWAWRSAAGLHLVLFAPEDETPTWDWTSRWAEGWRRVMRSPDSGRRQRETPKEVEQKHTQECLGRGDEAGGFFSRGWGIKDRKGRAVGGGW